MDQCDWTELLGRLEGVLFATSQNDEHFDNRNHLGRAYRPPQEIQLFRGYVLPSPREVVVGLSWKRGMPLGGIWAS